MPIDPAIPLSIKVPEPISPLQTIGQLMQMKNGASEIALRGAQTRQAEQQAVDLEAQAQQRQRDLQSTNKLQELLRDPNVQQTLGSGDYTPIYNAGISPNIADSFIKSHQSMIQTAQTLQKGKADFYAAGRQALVTGIEGLDPKDDDVAAQQYNQFRQTLAADHPELAQKLPPIAAGPNFRQQIQDLAAGNGIARAILENQAGLESKQAETAKNTAQANEATAGAAKTTTETARLQQQIDAAKNPQTLVALDAQIDNELPGSKGPEYAYENAIAKQAVRGALATGMPDALEKAQAAIKDSADRMGRYEASIAQAKATQPIKIDIAGAEAAARANAIADAAGYTPDDYARTGEQYARTGVMPELGRDSITRGKIVQAASAWARDNGLSPADVVTMQAAYQGDKESLKKFQAQRDQIVSFEQTAQKNLDLFLGAASKIPDTGVPWLNTPLRSLDAKLVGSENMAAVNAAREVANNEIAKVTTGGGMSAVLSDSARNEVKSYNPQNATFAQTLAVAQVLKADMANRHQSMDATLGDIKTRLANGGQTAKTYTQADLDAAIKAQPGMSGAQIEAAFQAKGWKKSQ